MTILDKHNGKGSDNGSITRDCNFLKYPMKTIKALFLILFITVFSTMSYSQQLKVSVNQLEMGAAYTRTQILDKLGTPDSIVNEPDDVFLNVVTYKYGNNTFTTVEGELCFITLKDSTFSVNGILRVGQNKNTITQMGGIIVYDKINSQKNYGIIKWKPFENYLNGYGSLLIFYNLQTGLINMISFQLILL